MNSSALRRLAALNLAPEAMAEVLSIFADLAASDEDRLRKQRERKAKSRAGHGTVTGQGRDGHSDNPSPKERSPKPPKETTPSHRSTKPTVSTTDIAREFAEDFWPAYPNKVGKLKAAAAFDRARRKVTLPVILAGLDRYVRDKPADRSWCNPETWLNQERWADQPAPLLQATGPPRQHQPRRNGWATILETLDEPAPDDDRPYLDLATARH